MRIFLGILIIFQGLALCSYKLKNTETDLIKYMNRSIVGRIQDFKEYAEKHPFQNDETKQAYAQGMTDLNNWADLFRQTWIDHTPIAAAGINILAPATGLFYLAAGILLIRRSKFVTPMMLASFWSGLLLFILLYVFLTSLNDFYFFKFTQTVLNLGHSLGIFKGNSLPIQMPATTKELKIQNLLIVGVALIYLIIPIIYLAKAFTKREGIAKSVTSN